MNICLVWRDGTDFTSIQKYIILLTEPACLAAYFFPYKHPARKKYVTLRTSFIQATHFQFCHNYLKPICF